MMSKLIKTILVVSLLMAGSAFADPIVYPSTVTFNSIVGSYGTWQATVGSPGIQIAAFYYTGGSWQHATLFGRNQAPNDVGVGICNPGETANCGTGQGGGDYNEISNNINPEVIRITLPTGYMWRNVQVSSLDNNGGGGNEHGVLYASNSATPLAPGVIGTQICTFANSGAQTCVRSGGDAEDPILTIGTGYQSSHYLYLEARDWNLPTNRNNDFLLRAVTVTTTVPEPGTWVLLGSGMLGMAGTVRRRFKK